MAYRDGQWHHYVSSSRFIAAIAINSTSPLSAGLYLRKNSVLRELWLAHNDLTCDDAYNIGIVLKSNFYLQFLDMSNNNIQVTE